MKLAIASSHDLNDVRRGSGTFYYMIQELERQGHTVMRLAPFTFKIPLATRVIHTLNGWAGKRHVLFLDPFVGKRTGMQVGRQLAGLDYDVLLTKDMCAAAFTPTPKPIVIYTDVMITPNYSEKNLPGCRLGKMSTVSLALCRRTFRRALRRCHLAAFPAQWSADAARFYCKDPEKIKLIPFGANLADPGAEIAERRLWQKIRQKGCFDLLFVGKEWIRKGGDVAVDTVRCLNRSGFEARLHVVGTRVPYDVPPDQVQDYGLLDKSKPDELLLLERLYAEADAFILPSSSEGYNNSVLMAGAFGLPTLAYDADGVRDAITPGNNGQLFPLASQGRVFAEAIRRWEADPASYGRLVAGARRHYETKANWRTAVRTLIEGIDDVLRSPSRDQALTSGAAVRPA